MAPVVGCILLTSAGLFRLTILGARLSPVLSLTILLCISSTLVFKYRKRLVNHLSRNRLKRLLPTLIPSLALFVFFAFLFHSSGFELLSASEDELQYTSNSKQMLFEQNTGSRNDIPAARVDHWTADVETRYLPYCNVFRRGAEILLASTMSVMSLKAELAFPLLVGCVISNLLLMLGFVGPQVFRLSVLKTLYLQIIFLALFYLVKLHLTGSLANLCSLSCLVGALALLPKALDDNSKPELSVLTGILIGGSILFYCDVFLFSIALPTLAILASYLYRKRANLVAIGNTLRNLIIGSLVAAAVANEGMESLVGTFRYNVDALVQQQAHDEWLTVFGNLLGFASFWEDSKINGQIQQLMIDNPWLIFSIGVVFYGFAILGFRKCGKNGLGMLVALSGLLLIASVMMFLHDSFRLQRCLGYSIPYMTIGLVLATTGDTTGWSRVALACTVAFVSLNAASNIRTLSYLTKHNQFTDHIVQRINPDHVSWQMLKRELSSSGDVPVLLSEFKDDPKPHAIANVIEPIPNFQGPSTYAYTHRRATADVILSRDPTLSATTPRNQWHRLVPLPDWDKDIPRFIESSTLAVVPPNGGYPPEWKRSLDIYDPKRSRYRNICDVLYRKEKAARLEDSSVGALESDSVGLFRSLLKPAHVVVDDFRYRDFVLRIVYSGSPNDLALVRDLNGASTVLPVQSAKLSTDGMSYLQSHPLHYGELQSVKLLPGRVPIKLRQVSVITDCDKYPNEKW